MLERVSVGLLVSSRGTYNHMGRSTIAGLRNAIAEINEDSAFDFILEAKEYDPEGELEEYVAGLAQLNNDGVKHIFGTTTSASRKEIIPDLERTESLLWYPVPYEGYECSQNVLYLGGCPNQNLLPLLHYAICHFGPSACLIGSNYVWGWESNRIAREIVELAQGEVQAEKYYRFGDSDFKSLIDSILIQQPGFVLNNLVGESSYHFLEQLSEACAVHGIKIPVLSCNFTESELSRFSGADSIRLLSCGAFFEDVDMAFVANQHHRHGIQPISHLYTCAYVSMYLFAAARQRVGHDDPVAITEALCQLDVATVLGHLTLSEHNNHFALPSYITEVVKGRFDVIHAEGKAIVADPYLVQSDFDIFRNFSSRSQKNNHLRLVK